ncbi:hypothetical protein C1H46_008068 [Malus baccata]|uniref:Uncharacterized protein n=1 Tax=Malus baccata TaxID=106549 RepID=A0A540N5K0_MALBA|nr:hypothetical protein C1H46_008068 [Malus baccata]
MSKSHQLATITIAASSPDSPSILPIASSDHHHTILTVENTTIILQIPRDAAVLTWQKPNYRLCFG